EKYSRLGMPIPPRRAAAPISCRMATSDSPILHAVRSTLGGQPRVVLAVSGGLDSMSLLDAASRVVDSNKLVIATFDHGTGKAAREAVCLVQSRAASLGLVCE